MTHDDLDVEQLGESLDGAEVCDRDDASDGAGDALRARRIRPPKHQGRRGTRDRENPRTDR